jgi:hypothetical protein
MKLALMTILQPSKREFELRPYLKSLFLCFRDCLSSQQLVDFVRQELLLVSVVQVTDFV